MKQYLEKGYSTLNITFAWLACPNCRKELIIPDSMPVLGPIIQRWKRMKEKMMELADREARTAGLRASDRFRDPDGDYYNDWANFALDSCTFYECQVCKEPYFGGLNECR